MKLLVLSENIYFIKKLNNILNTNNIPIKYICTNLEEVEKVVFKEDIEIMIIEKRITIKELYNILDEMVLKKTKIILCTNITTIPNKLLDKIYIPKISEDDNAYFDEIFNIIKRHSQAKSNEEKISDKILLEMKKMGFEMKNKGD